MRPSLPVAGEGLASAFRGTWPRMFLMLPGLTVSLWSPLWSSSRKMDKTSYRCFGLKGKKETQTKIRCPNRPLRAPWGGYCPPWRPHHQFLGAALSMEDEQKAREKISPPQTAHGSDSGQPCLRFPHVPLTVVTEPVPTLLLSIWHLLEAAAENHSSETCAHMTCSSSVAQTVSLSSICPSRPPLDFFSFFWWELSSLTRD